MRGISQFGGFIELGGKKLAVSGRTLRHIFEIESYLNSLLYNPVDELRRLQEKSECLRKKTFIAEWIKQCRMMWLGRAEELKAIFLGSPEGKVFSLWQAVRENGVSYEDVLVALDSSDHVDLYQSLARALSVASGQDETSAFSELRKRTPSGGEKISLDGAIAWLISERSWKLDDILDMTMTTLRQVRSSAMELDDGIDKELLAETIPELSMLKEQHRRIYRRAAEAFLEGRRINDWSDKDDKTKWPLIEIDVDGTKHLVLECRKCLQAGKDSKHVRLRKFQVALAPPIGLVTRMTMVCQVCGYDPGRKHTKPKEAVDYWNARNRPEEPDED